MVIKTTLIPFKLLIDELDKKICGRCKHIIATFTLIHFLLLLFLSIHFSAWGGVYTEDGLSVECIVAQEMHIVRQGIDTIIDSGNDRCVNRYILSEVNFNSYINGSLINYFTAAFILTGLCGLVLFAYFYYRVMQISFFVPDTPVHLSVRLNN